MIGATGLTAASQTLGSVSATGANFAYSVMRFANVNTASPIDGAISDTQGNTTVSGSVTPNIGGTVGVAEVCVNNNATGITASTPSGWTQVTSASGNGGGCFGFYSTAALASGSANTFSTTLSGSYNAELIMLALNPANPPVLALSEPACVSQPTPVPGTAAQIDCVAQADAVPAGVGVNSHIAQIYGSPANQSPYDANVADLELLMSKAGVRSVRNPYDPNSGNIAYLNTLYSTYAIQHSVQWEPPATTEAQFMLQFSSPALLASILWVEGINEYDTQGPAFDNCSTYPWTGWGAPACLSQMYTNVIAAISANGYSSIQQIAAPLAEDSNASLVGNLSSDFSAGNIHFADVPPQYPEDGNVRSLITTTAAYSGSLADWVTETNGSENDCPSNTSSAYLTDQALAYRIPRMIASWWQSGSRHIYVYQFSNLNGAAWTGTFNVPNTTVASAANGATSITVASSTGYAVGEKFYINGSQAQAYTIGAISGTTWTISPAITGGPYTAATITDQTQAIDPTFGCAGMVFDDGTPKAQYTAFANFLNLLADPGSAFTPSTFTATLGGNYTNVEHITLQKRDGSTWMMLWLAYNGWNTTTHTYTAATPQTVTITPSSFALSSAEKYAYNTSTWELTASSLTPSGGSVSVPVSDAITFVRLAPSTVTATPAPAPTGIPTPDPSPNPI